jgi:hypothetical protein
MVQVLELHPPMLLFMSQISTRLLVSLNMICEVHIKQIYGYPFTDNLRITIRHLSPHLGIIVALSLRVV